MDIIESRTEQIRQIGEIARGFENYYCVECADAIQEYLTNQGIHGNRLNLYTGSTVKPKNYIYDDTIPGEAISGMADIKESPLSPPSGTAQR